MCAWTTLVVGTDWGSTDILCPLSCAQVKEEFQKAPRGKVPQLQAAATVQHVACSTKCMTPTPAWRGVYSSYSEESMWPASS